MIFFVVINTAIAAVAIILGAIVLNNGPRNVTYQSFFIFTTGLALSAAATFDLPPYLVRNLLSVVMLGACIICFSDLILPAFGVYRFSTTSNFLALIILVIGGFGIAHYGIGHGSIILRRGIPYFLSLISIAVIFFSGEFGIEKFFYHNDRVVDVAVAVVGKDDQEFLSFIARRAAIALESMGTTRAYGTTSKKV